MDKTCKELIAQKWEGLLSDIKKANRNDKAREEFIGNILSRDETRTVRYCLSYGGPADYIEMDFNKENEVLEARYLYQDWGDGAVKILNEEEKKEVIDLLDASEFEAMQE